MLERFGSAAIRSLGALVLLGEMAGCSERLRGTRDPGYWAAVAE